MAKSNDARMFPPWQNGKNNDVVERGLDFTVPEIDVLSDFHGDPFNAKLVLYVGGNYFFAMAPLVETFERKYPQFKGRIYWETIPPGLLVKQMKAGGVITVGNMTWTAKPDVYFAGLKATKKLVDEGVLVGPAVGYVSNGLTIMVAKGNPLHIKGLADLARPDVRLAMPDPEFEGVARQIKASLRKAGGDALVTAVYEKKVRDGSAELTRIHHRQTPLSIMQHRVDAGVTWRSEALFQAEVGNPIEHVDIPSNQDTAGNYGAAVVKNAANAAAGKLWLDYIASDEAMAIFKRYGFKPYSAGGDEP